MFCAYSVTNVPNYRFIIPHLDLSSEFICYLYNFDCYVAYISVVLWVTPFVLFFDVFPSLTDDCPHMIVRKGIKYRLAFSPAFHKMCLS